MIVEARAITYFIWIFAVFQFVIAGWLLCVPRPSPARVVHAVLLVLNGVSSAALGLVNADPFAASWGTERGLLDWPWLQSLVYASDLPTGAWLILLSAILARTARLDDIGWSRAIGTSIAILAVGTLTLAVALVALPHTFYYSYWGYWVGELPLVIAYGALIVVLGRAVVHATTSDQRRLYTLLFIAFGVRIVEFAYRYTFGKWGYVSPDPPPWYVQVDDHLYYGVAAICVWTLVRIAVYGLRLPLPDRRYCQAIVVACAATLVFTIGYWDYAHGITLYGISLLSLVLVRPLFIGLGYEPGWTVRSAGMIGILTGVFFAAKALAAELTGAPFWDVGRTDIYGAGAALLALTPALVWSGPVNKRMRFSDSFQPLTHAQRLALHLMEQHNRTDDGIDGAKLSEHLGISRKNLAGELRRMENLLTDSGATHGRFLEERTVGVRGRKMYRLTEEGCVAVREAARSWASPPPRGTRSRASPISGS